MRRLLRVVGVGLAVLVGGAVAAAVLFALVYMMDDTRALPKVSAAQFDAIELGLTQDQLFHRLGPVTLTGGATIGGRREECWYYPVAGGPTGVGNDAYRFCFFGDRLAHKQHTPYP
jgi:hypothetical protein